MAEERQEIDWQEVGQQLSVGMNTFVQQLNEVMGRMAESVKPVIDGYLTLAQNVHNAVHTSYIQEGAIYGDTQEGMLRWMEEKGKIVRLRADADRLEQHHEGLRVFRQRLIEAKDEATKNPPVLRLED